MTVIGVKYIFFSNFCVGPQWSHPLSSSVLGGVVASGANTLNHYVAGNNIGPVNGVIAKMTGITPNQPTGTGWDIAIGVSKSYKGIPNMNISKYYRKIKELINPIISPLFYISGRLETHLHTRKTKPLNLLEHLAFICVLVLSNFSSCVKLILVVYFQFRIFGLLLGVKTGCN